MNKTLHIKIGLVFEFTMIKRQYWSTEMTEKESGCWVGGCRAQLVTFEGHFINQTPAEVHRPISLRWWRYTYPLVLSTQPVSRSPAWAVGLICQFTVHDIPENCWLSLLMLLSIKENPEKYGCSGTSTLFSQPCSRKGHTGQRSGVDNCGQNLVCLPQPTLLGSMCHSLVLPVSTCFYLRCGTRICDLNVWDHHFKSHVSLLRARDRCQGCCLVVSNIKADSDYERNSSSAGSWFVKRETLGNHLVYIFFCRPVSSHSHLTFLPQWHSSPTPGSKGEHLLPSLSARLERCIKAGKRREIQLF